MEIQDYDLSDIERAKKQKYKRQHNFLYYTADEIVIDWLKLIKDNGYKINQYLDTIIKKDIESREIWNETRRQ